MRKVITCGTFGLPHRGYINLLKRTKAMGDHLVVGLSSDDFRAWSRAVTAWVERQRK